MLTTHDCKVLCNVVNDKENKGRVKGRGTTIAEIVEKTGLTTTSVNRILKKLVAEGLVNYGIKRVKSYTFYITEKGINEIKELKGIK